jgi:hypothetical protein
MDSSTVQLGTASAPDVYQGRVESLNGTDIVARLHDANGAHITVTMQLTVDPQSNAVGGTATARRKVAQ